MCSGRLNTEIALRGSTKPASVLDFIPAQQQPILLHAASTLTARRNTFEQRNFGIAPGSILANLGGFLNPTPYAPKIASVTLVLSMGCGAFFANAESLRCFGVKHGRPRFATVLPASRQAWEQNWPGSLLKNGASWITP